MTPAALFACVLSLVDPALTPLESCWEDPHVQRLTNAVGRAAQETGVPPRIIIAVAFHESRLNPQAIGRRFGEIGYMQLKRGGALQGRWARASRWVLMDPVVNMTLGARYLALVARRCQGPPVYYLSRYNGRACKPSRYSRAVLRKLWDAQKEVKSAQAVKYIVDVSP